MSTGPRVLVAERCPALGRRAAERLRASGCDVVGIARDGRDAMRLALAARPDVLLLDVMIDGPGSVDVTCDVTSAMGSAVLLWSGYRSDAEVRLACEGLRAGALEVCAKPEGEASEALWLALLSTVEAAARVHVLRRGRSGPRHRGPVVVIGASTGGPRALKRIASQLPGDFPAPIVVALHGAADMDIAGAAWLQSVSRLEVRSVRTGVSPDGSPGCIWLAPPGLDIAWRGPRLHLEPPLDAGGIAPSIDRLFQSTAATYGAGAIGVLLSGLGSDGASGLAAIARAGGRTIVQSIASSVAGSMPAAALAGSAAFRETPLERIATTLVELLADTQPHSTGGAEHGAND